MESKDSFLVNLEAFVLGSLDPDEHGHFLSHLKACRNCSEKVSGYQLVVDGLLLGVDLTPAPSHLRARVLTAATPPGGFATLAPFLRSPRMVLVTILAVTGCVLIVARKRDWM